VRCESDPRYQGDSLLADLQKAIERTGLRSHMPLSGISGS
jgi:hypothetical protein